MYVTSNRLKWGLTKNKPTYHHIVVGAGKLVPLELVQYDTGFAIGKSRISVQGSSYINVMARNKDHEMVFLSRLGIVEYGMVRVKSVTPRMCVDILVRQDNNAPIDPPLDISGYQALAFYTAHIASDLDKLADAGGKDSTPIFSAKVGVNEFDVCMIRSPEGTIVELIQPRG